jgi:hypothetical protein
MTQMKEEIKRFKMMYDGSRVVLKIIASYMYISRLCMGMQRKYTCGIKELPVVQSTIIPMTWHKISNTLLM